MGSHSLLQGVFSTQGPNPGLLHCRQILYNLSHQGRPLASNSLNFCFCLSEKIFISPSFFLRFFFFNVDHFKILYWICYNIASVVCFGFLALRHMGSYFPNQGSNLNPCIGRWSLNHRTTREVPLLHFLKDTFARYSILRFCFVVFSQNFTLYLLALS